MTVHPHGFEQDRAASGVRVIALDAMTRPRKREWRRRESNPRPQPHRSSVYKLVQRFSFARKSARWRPTAGLALLSGRAAGEWLSLGAEPVS